MEMQGVEVARKRMKPAMDQTEGEIRDGIADQVVVEDQETEANIVGSEEMELSINHILEKIENFTQLVSELLESGKTLFKELSSEFEDRMILIHKEQIEKWQEEIRELRLLDAANEEVNAVLHNARCLFQNVHLHS